MSEKPKIDALLKTCKDKILQAILIDYTIMFKIFET